MPSSQLLQLQLTCHYPYIMMPQVQQMSKQPHKRYLPSLQQRMLQLTVEITSLPSAESPEDSMPKMNKKHPRTAEDNQRCSLATTSLPGPAARPQVPTTGEVNPHAGAEEIITSLTGAN